MDSSKPIIFYDIASGPPVRTYAPNPWKTRYALNLKGVSYKTNWVELPDVESTRKKLGPAPNRVLPNGKDFYTLPIIQDTSNNDEIVGDSFDIAVYLDKHYPQGPRLIPDSCIGLTAAFNIRVDALFSQFAGLSGPNLPLNPETAHITRKQWEDRLSMSWDQMTLSDEARAHLIADMEKQLGEFAKAYRHCGGPFLEGKTPSYADIIVGGWLSFYKETLRKNEWESLCSWHDGRWITLHRALSDYAEIK